MNNRKRTDRKVACFLRPGESGRNGTEISPERTAAHAKVSCLTFSPALLKVKLGGFRELCPSGLDKMPVVVFLADGFAYGFFNTIEIEWRKKLAVGHGFNTVTVAADANKFFHVRI